MTGEMKDLVRSSDVLVRSFTSVLFFVVVEMPSKNNLAKYRQLTIKTYMYRQYFSTVISN